MTSELHVEADGPAPAAVTVIFAHGLGDDLLTWDLQREHLRDAGVRHVYYDHASFGRSPARADKPVRLSHLARDLGDLVDQQPAGPVVLVGHSMGSLTVIALAAERPELFGERVQAVVLAGSPGDGRHVRMLFPLALEPVARRAVPAVLTVLATLRANTWIGKGFFLLLARNAFGRSTRTQRAVLADKIAAQQPKILVEHLRACLAFEEPAAHDVLAGVRTHVVVGAKDRLVAPEGGRRLARVIPGTVLHDLDGVGHMMHIEAADQFNAIVDDVLATVTYPASGGHVA